MYICMFLWRSFMLSFYCIYLYLCSSIEIGIDIYLRMNVSIHNIGDYMYHNFAKWKRFESLHIYVFVNDLIPQIKYQHAKRVHCILCAYVYLYIYLIAYAWKKKYTKYSHCIFQRRNIQRVCRAHNNYAYMFKNKYAVTYSEYALGMMIVHTCMRIYGSRRIRLKQFDWNNSTETIRLKFYSTETIRLKQFD